MNQDSNEFSVNPYGPVVPSRHSLEGELELPLGMQPGMVAQVPILGVLMIIQGVLEILVSLAIAFYAFLTPMIFDQIRRDAAKNGGAQPPQLPPAAENWAMIVAVILAAGILLLAVLTILCGVRIMNYRARVLGITMLLVGLLTIATCYCFPTSLALAVYGMFVLLNTSVQHAFALRANGHEVRDIQRAFLSLP